MPSREKRARRRQRGSIILPALILILALVAAMLAVVLIYSNPLDDKKEDKLPFEYPDNLSFENQANATAAPLVFGGGEVEVQETPVPEQDIEQPLSQEEAQDMPVEEGNRLVPAVEEGDYFLPVFDRALRTPDDEAMIAITVDDCNKVEVMSQVLQIAQRYDAMLTLFPTGEALMDPLMTDGFKTCVRTLGYQLENHSFAHKAEYKLTSSELAIQVWKQSIAASYAVGRDLEQHFYRPYNKNSDYDQRTHYYIGKLGYQGIASYSHSYKEFKKGQTMDLDAMVDTLENGKIYQFDMTEDSMALLEPFIATASRKGYKLVTMNELFGLNEDVIGAELTIDQQTLVTMEDYVPTYYDLKLNYRTNAVFALQAQLMQLGYLDGANVKADGIYGSATSIAVSEFQARVGILATGNADAETQERLFALNAPVAGR